MELNFQSCFPLVIEFAFRYNYRVGLGNNAVAFNQIPKRGVVKRAFHNAGDKMVVEVEDLKTKELKTLTTDGIFVFIGLKPNLELFKNKLELDSWGYIKTDEDKRTNIDDVYAVGDVTSKKYRQITTAIADGTIAAISITREIDN